MSGYKCYFSSTLSGKECAEIPTFTSNLHMIYIANAFYQELYMCFREAPSFVLLLRTILSVYWCLLNEHIFSNIVLTSWSLLTQYLAKFSTPAGLEGRVSNKIVVSFITLFSCLSLLSVIWDYQMLGYSIFHGCCEEKASREKGYIKIIYYQQLLPCFRKGIHSLPHSSTQFPNLSDKCQVTLMRHILIY